MNNSKSGLVGILSFIAMTAASLGFLGAASRTASAHSAGRAPVAVVRDAAEPTVSYEVTVDEVTVEGRVPAKKAAVKPAVAAPASEPAMTCRARSLEQGPEAMTVVECHPAW